ncbi:hypothetical protein [Salmonirosea aquatica]|uniref:Phytanoyl-CoA dioxygenase n=1 Tax=Salmonirosea aquatica TaxID=2654236 RepID=A0A7C9FZ31_9BACT|nr:hypothetical protein [Cytophagaceae bacterium SJW1-29]
MKLNSKILLFYLQRLIKSYSTREVLSKAEARFIGKVDIKGKSILFNGDEKEYTNKFLEDGYVEFFPSIDKKIIDQIINETTHLSLFDPYEKSYGEFTLIDLKPNTHVANFHRLDLVKNKKILEIANDPGILRIVQEFLGATPTISNVNMWWSIAGKSKAEHAQLFHRDVDDLKFCKLFVYLTDVGPNDGPHTYVKGSSSTNKLTKIRRYQDQEVVDAFGSENVIDFCRPKGSFFLVDTYGFHKGTLPVDNNRLLLQIQYSLNPIGIENYTPVDMLKENNYNKYINRLIIN